MMNPHIPSTVKPVLSGHLKTDITKVVVMKVKMVA